MFLFVCFGSDLEIAIFMHDGCLARNCLVTLKRFTPGFHIHFFIQLLSTRIANEVKTWNLLSSWFYIVQGREFLNSMARGATVRARSQAMFTHCLE